MRCCNVPMLNNVVKNSGPKSPHNDDIDYDYLKLLLL